MRFIFYVISFITLFFGCTNKKEKALPPVNVNAFTVKQETIPATFTFAGIARSSHPVEIRARVEGYLLSINYIEGSKVEKDQLLFRLDPRPFEESLTEAQGELARQEAIFSRAKRDLERIESLYEQKAASRRDRDNALSQVEVTEATMMEAEAKVHKAELNVKYTYITSPLRGLSGRATSKEGSLIMPSINGLLTEVSVIDPIWVLFSISDSELLQGKSNQFILPKEGKYTVELTLADGSTFPYKGEVNFSSPLLDPEKTGSFTVRAQFPNPDQEILPGQFVQAIVSGAFRPNAIYVPQEAVLQGNRGMYVFVINDKNIVEARNVEVEECYKNTWIVKSGLSEGERVVSMGINKIQNGSLVHILNEKGKTD